jgi:hypothetical protein
MNMNKATEVCIAESKESLDTIHPVTESLKPNGKSSKSTGKREKVARTNVAVVPPCSYEIDLNQLCSACQFKISPPVEVKKIGTREEVFERKALRTKGGLTSDDLVMNSKGAIVSKKASAQGREKMQRIWEQKRKLNTNGNSASNEEVVETCIPKNKKHKSESTTNTNHATSTVDADGVTDTGSDTDDDIKS